MIEESSGADASPEPREMEPAIDTAATEVEVEEAVDTAPEAPESEAESPPADEENVEEKTDPFKERIDKLTANWRETQRTLQAREQELSQLQEQLQSVPKAQEPTRTLADFDYDESKFQEYIMGRAAELARDEARTALKEEQSMQAAQKAEVEYKQREQAFADTAKDYFDLVYDRSLSISAPMADAIRVMEEGPEVAYYLAKNPDKAHEIALESGTRAAVSMAELRSKLVAEKAKAKKQVSNAPPPPPKKIGGAEAGMKKDPSEMTDAEFAKWRRNQIARRY